MLIEDVYWAALQVYAQEAGIFFTFLTAALGVVNGVHNSRRLQEIHVIVNSRTDALMRDVANLNVIVGQQKATIDSTPRVNLTISPQPNPDASQRL